MKITKNDIFWWVVIGVAFAVIVSGCLAMVIKSNGATARDEQQHRAKIARIYPSVSWPEYRDAAREICKLDSGSFRLVKAMADDDGPEASQAFSINVEYLCPERLESVEK